MAIQFQVNPNTVILDGNLLDSITAFEEYIRNSIENLHGVDSCLVAYDDEDNITGFLFGFCKPNTVNKDVTYIFAAVDSDSLVRTKDHRTAVGLIRSASARFEVYVTWIITDRYVKIGK